MTVSSFPLYFRGLAAAGSALCTGPVRAYGPHSAPVFDSMSAFTLMSPDGFVVSEWIPDVKYTLQVYTAFRGHIWVHASDGIFPGELTDGYWGPVVECDFAAWHAGPIDSEHIMQWVAPACCTSREVVVTVTAADSQFDNYHISKVTLFRDFDHNCPCGDGMELDWNITDADVLW